MVWTEYARWLNIMILMLNLTEIQGHATPVHLICQGHVFCASMYFHQEAFYKPTRSLFLNKVSIDTLFVPVFQLSFGLLHI